MCHGLNKDTNYDLSETRAAAVPASRHGPGEYPTIFGSHYLATAQLILGFALF